MTRLTEIRNRHEQDSKEMNNTSKSQEHRDRAYLLHKIDYNVDALIVLRNAIELALKTEDGRMDCQIIIDEIDRITESKMTD